MINKHLIFERIIGGDLRPWLEVNRDEEKFVPILGDIKQIAPEFKSLYEIDFYPFFSEKTRYYHKLITNEANNYCNKMIELINSDDDKRFIKYWLDKTLKKKLRTLFQDVAKLIEINDLDLKYIDPHNVSFNIDKDHKTNTYIIQFLKTALLKVYLEIQEAFKSFITPDDYMGLDILLLSYLSEPLPEQTFLKRQTILEISAIDVKQGKTKAEKVLRFTPNSFKYIKSATNPGALNDIFDSLKLHLFIDKKSSINDFKKVFSGKEIANPIIWTGNPSEFYWFIHLICKKYKLVSDLKQYQWKVASQCFVQADGTPFDRNKLRNLKRPQLSGALLEKAVGLLK